MINQLMMIKPYNVFIRSYLRVFDCLLQIPTSQTDNTPLLPNHKNIPKSLILLRNGALQDEKMGVSKMVYISTQQERNIEHLNFGFV